MQNVKELRFIYRGTAAIASLPPALLEIEYNKIFDELKKFLEDFEINLNNSSIEIQRGGMIVSLKNDLSLTFEETTNINKRLNESYDVVSFKHEADSLDNDIPHATYIFYPKDTK